VKRELEPLAGYSLSAGIVLLIMLFSFLVSSYLPMPSGASKAADVAMPTAFTLALSGLFIVIARKKALTQVIGFLMFENGITLFGTAVMREHPVIVELGILLDVLALVFIMGITVYQIRREFAHIDSDKLNLLDDLSENMEAEK
jgi:hydrogenase-4 component E